MNSLILPMVLGYVLTQLASAGAAENWAADEAAFDKYLQQNAYLKNHPQLDAMLENIAHPLILGIAKATQDSPDIKAAVLALANKDTGAAGAAMIALATTSAPQLTAMLAT